MRVNSVDGLRTAIRDAQSDMTIALQPGQYTLSEPLTIDGGNNPLTNIAIRGSVTTRGDVVIEHTGIVVGNVDGMLVADLTFRNLSRQAIEVRGDAGATRVRIYNVRFEDVLAQAVRVTASSDTARDGAMGSVEHSDFEYTRVTDGANGSNAIAIYGGRNWIIKYNRFLNMRSGPKSRNQFRPAVVARAGAADTHTHNNLFIDCDRAIAYGAAERDEAADHRRGTIYNNFIYRRRGLRGDAGIMLWGSPDTRVYHNTVIQNGTYQRAIEYRFNSTTGVDIRNNLTDGLIAGRDGAHATVAANYMKAMLAMFRDPRAGDLRLVPGANNAIDRGVPLPGSAFDWDGERRPLGSRPDIGADESR